MFWLSHLVMLWLIHHSWLCALPQVVEVTPRKAVLQWVAPELGSHQEELAVTELRYEVFLNDKSYDTIHTTQLSITGLNPATDYRVL